MKIYKKLLLLLIGFLVLSLLFLLIQIYAKYLSSANGNTEISIARWNILVNETSIKNNTDISNNIIPVFPGNEHIASDIIAPNATGYFDLELDYSSADVSFKYEITTSVSPESSVQDLVSTGYSIDDGTIINFDNYNDTITDTVPLNSTNKTRKYRIYIKWNDDENNGAVMTNAQDTEATISSSSPLFNVNISFTQISET